MDPINKQIGCLIPLTVGHNGIFTKRESEVLDFHLVNAGFMKWILYRKINQFKWIVVRLTSDD
jgi:hypothetical protein